MDYYTIQIPKGWVTISADEQGQLTIGYPLDTFTTPGKPLHMSYWSSYPTPKYHPYCMVSRELLDENTIKTVVSKRDIPMSGDLLILVLPKDVLSRIAYDGHLPTWLEDLGPLSHQCPRTVLCNNTAFIPYASLVKYLRMIVEEQDDRIYSEILDLFLHLDTGKSEKWRSTTFVNYITPILENTYKCWRRPYQSLLEIFIDYAEPLIGDYYYPLATYSLGQVWIAPKEIDYWIPTEHDKEWYNLVIPHAIRRCITMCDKTNPTDFVIHIGEISIRAQSAVMLIEIWERAPQLSEDLLPYFCNTLFGRPARPKLVIPSTIRKQLSDKSLTDHEKLDWDSSGERLRHRHNVLLRGLSEILKIPVRDVDNVSISKLHNLMFIADSLPECQNWAKDVVRKTWGGR